MGTTEAFMVINRADTFTADDMGVWARLEQFGYIHPHWVDRFVDSKQGRLAASYLKLIAKKVNPDYKKGSKNAVLVDVHKCRFLIKRTATSVFFSDEDWLEVKSNADVLLEPVSITLYIVFISCVDRTHIFLLHPQPDKP
jgi:hypothetical protein